MFSSFYYDWTLAEAAKKAVLPHCCWVPKMKALQPPQQSCIKSFLGWCRNEFRSNKTYLSMFNRFYYDLTLSEAAKIAALPHYCCWVTKLKVLQPPQHSCISAFLDWCRNEFGSNKTYISMFNRFYYDWALAEAAKKGCPATMLLLCDKLKVLQSPQHSCI